MRVLKEIVQDRHGTYYANLSSLARELRRLVAEKERASGIKKTRAKPGVTHRSKKDKRLTWTGRGSIPRWMRQEMKALRLKPDAFRIR
jgi:DNA-binding protein H-NS